MHAEFLLFANLILLSRLLYLTHDAALSRRANAALAGGQGLGLLFCFSLNAAALGTLGTIIGVALLCEVLERRIDLRNGFRLLTLALLLLIPAYLDALGQGLVLRLWLVQAIEHVLAVLPLLGGAPDWQPPLLFLFGILLLANEANIVVRAVFHHCRLEPRQPPASAAAPSPAAGTDVNTAIPAPEFEVLEPEVMGRSAPAAAGELIDRQEYNAGRVIGFLERWLMFLVIIMSGDFNALAFIIAAKGLARMKQLEDRQFAEYMLIGTFLSALCAMLVALLVRRGL